MKIKLDMGPRNKPFGSLKVTAKSPEDTTPTRCVTTFRAEGGVSLIETTLAQVTLSEVYGGVGIRTDRALFGIAERDGGIEVMRDGVLVWSSEHGPVEAGPVPAVHLPAEWGTPEVSGVTVRR